jgi:hypothetical protein
MRLAGEDGRQEHQIAGPEQQTAKQDPPDTSTNQNPQRSPLKQDLQPLGVHPGLNRVINTASMPAYLH